MRSGTKIIFVTGNNEKLREVKEILGDKFIVINRNIDLEEIQEVNGEKIIIQKVRSAYNKVKQPVIVEDTSLYITAWNGLPGALNKWFMKTVGNDGIIKMLSVYNNRSAQSITLFAYYDGIKISVFRGIVNGSISEIPKGENGFGWDKIFISDVSDKTQAELTGDEKNKVSSRNKALEKLKLFLLKKYE